MGTKLYRAEVFFEASINVCGNNFLVIYGYHVNGGYCCIPNWKLGCEMGDPGDVFYNYECLVGAGLNETEAQELAKAIERIASKLKPVVKEAIGTITTAGVPHLPIRKAIAKGGFCDLAIAKASEDGNYSSVPLVISDDKTFILSWDEITELATRAGLFAEVTE